MLKYEHIEAGTIIRAYDHQPMTGREEYYVQGEVIGTCTKWGADFLIMVPAMDTTFKDYPNRVGVEVLVPQEIVREYTDRIMVIGD